MINGSNCNEMIGSLLGTDDMQLIEEFKLQLKFLRNNRCVDDNLCSNLEELATTYEKNGDANISFAELSLLSDCSCLKNYEDSLDEERDDDEQ